FHDRSPLSRITATAYKKKLTNLRIRLSIDFHSFSSSFFKSLYLIATASAMLRTATHASLAASGWTHRPIRFDKLHRLAIE
ncbi:MAG: hypothetical protein LUK37_00425, partial [Clostridia bacterium]|nr:hypothetical protein [Clostridia bacterium]